MKAWIELLSKPVQDAHFTALFLDAMIKSFVVLALAAGTCALWRRASAATRHLVWFSAVACLPCLPLLTASLPSGQKALWSISAGYDSANQVSLGLELAPGKNFGASTPDPQISPAVAEKSHAGREPSGDSHKFSAHFGASWLEIGFAVWGIGVALVLFSLAAGQLRLRRFSRQAQRLENADWTAQLAAARETLRLRRAVTLLQSADNVMPLTWGWWKPVVLLPAGAKNWPGERRRIVLLHELAHVKRWDCLTQIAVKVVCAFYWFNPLVWRAARQMCVERERACDDLVLIGGCRASDYAAHLVEIAESFRRVPQVAAIAMARASGLEQRVAAILDGHRNRNRVAKLTVVLLVMALLSLGWLVGSYAAENSPQAWTLKNSPAAEPLKRFVAEKAAQESTLIEADEKDFTKYYASEGAKLVLPDCRPFFAAAANGDWLTVSNVWSEMQKHTLGLSTSTNGYPHGMWLQPVREAYGAIEAFTAGNGRYSEIFGDDVIQSIPPGSVYFGGTDPGRFIITALQKSQLDGEPFFTLTQNALADGTYLEYLRSMFGGKIYLPTGEDSQKSFQDYIAGATQRLHNHQLKPGENITEEKDNGRIQVSGQTAVMEINGLLVKIIFDRNTNREFFIEESLSFDWMYPHLEPHGLIFKINRQPLPELSDELVQQDRAFWQKLVSGMIGGWLNDDTSVREVTVFAEKVFIRHDLGGFTGDPGFVQNDYTSRMYSKLRSSIAGLYAWRAQHAADASEKERMNEAADYAFRQAFALCPYSPEAVFRYVNLLLSEHRLADAVAVAETAAKMPAMQGGEGDQFRSLARQLQNYQKANQTSPDGK
jgi:beta-lactamase regulating signal transducer with metallopeptidase domain